MSGAARPASAVAPPIGGGEVAVPLSTPQSATASLPLRLNMHIRNVGDRSFAGAEWAGRSGTGKWIEAFSIIPLEQAPSLDIEYKGLAATGAETPWIGNGGECGTRGKAMPLVGFAVRLRQNTMPSAFDCEYSGYFASGNVVGPLKNGAPCRSSLKNDPLEGVQVRITPRSSAAVASSQSPEPAVVGPRFSKLREDDSDRPSQPAARRVLRDSAAPSAEKTAAIAPQPVKGARKSAPGATAVGASRPPLGTTARPAPAVLRKEPEPTSKTSRPMRLAAPAVPVATKEGPRFHARAKRK
jgi:hypothetical protein